MKIRLHHNHAPVFKGNGTNYRVKKTTVLSIFFAGCLFVSSGSQVTKDPVNVPVGGNAIAYANPISAIRIDGEISDWPANIAHYAIQNLDADALNERQCHISQDLWCEKYIHTRTR